MENLKQVILGLGLGVATLFPISAQKVYHSTKSEVHFDAGKNIEATSRNSKFIYRASDNALVGLINIKDFVFSNSLMQEHFNENYLESDKYPNASFSGKLIGFNMSEVGSEEKEYTVKGKMNIHGEEKAVEFPIFISKKQGNRFQLKSNFKVLLEDYKIKVPKVVFVKIAQEVSIKVTTDLE